MVDWPEAVAQKDTYIARVADLRQRFQRRPESAGWLDSLRRAWRFLALAVGKARDDELNQQSAALAFITLFSLIPFLSTFSFIGARAFEQEDIQQKMLELFSDFFAYSEDILIERLGSFLDNAHTISGFGFLIFLATALMAFASVEQTINRVWNVPRRRPLRVRLVSFTLLLFWGPMLIGATYSGLFFLSDVEVVGRFARSLPARFLPFAMTLVGLTMLYWLVPYTKVQPRNAFGGALVATILLEALRQSFGFYTAAVQTVWIVYKTVGLAFIFMVSVHVSWWIILLGSEVAYCIQHYPVLLRERRRGAVPEGSWLALVGLVVLTERFRKGDPITSHELLADRLKLPTPEVLDVLRPLVEAGFVKETGGDEDGFLLACDPYQIRLTEIFELYERDHWDVLEPLSESSVEQLEKLRVRFTESREKSAGERVVADLLGIDESGS